LFQVALHHGSPTSLDRDGDPRIAITWEIADAEGFIDQEEVKELGSPWSVAHSSDALAIDKAVDQAGFAYIRAPRDSDLRKPQEGTLIYTSCALDELHVSNIEVIDHQDLSG